MTLIIAKDLKRSESSVKWNKPYPFTKNGFAGHAFPIVHADHAHGSMGRYEIVAIWWLSPVMPTVATMYFSHFSRFYHMLTKAEFVQSKIPWVPFHQSIAWQQYPDLFNIQPHKMQMGRERELVRAKAGRTEDVDVYE